MKYIIQLILIFFAFFICKKEKIKFKKAIEKEMYDFGAYKFSPLSGEYAVKKAKIGLFLSGLIPWLFIVLFLVYDIKLLINLQ